MRVFISWSGEPSRSIAKALRKWLPMVVQHVDAWMSDEDIHSGARWNDAIAETLDDTNFGIVCATRGNQSAPWLIFEAGALAKSVDKAKVVPLCIDLAPSEITGPLAAFQGRSLDARSVRRLVHEISAASEKPMNNLALDDLFDAMWPNLNSSIEMARQKAPAKPARRRQPDDMLSEIVESVRRIERYIDSPPVPPDIDRPVVPITSSAPKRKPLDPARRPRLNDPSEGET
jgi:hypothetical protein